MSYPYYAKDAALGDSTYFRHIDLNVALLSSEERGASQIQGSVTLDDEYEDGQMCTIIVPKMHKPGKLSLWWNEVKKRGLDTNSFKQSIRPSMFTDEDARMLGTTWKSVPCRRGQVLITDPKLPHGSDGPTRFRLRTMLLSPENRQK